MDILKKIALYLNPLKTSFLKIHPWILFQDESAKSLGLCGNVRYDGAGIAWV